MFRAKSSLIFSQSDCRPYMGSHTQSQLFCNGISVVQPLPNISNTSTICRFVNFSTNFVCGCIRRLCRQCLTFLTIVVPPVIVHLTNNIPRKNNKTYQSNINTIFHRPISYSAPVVSPSPISPKSNTISYSSGLSAFGSIRQPCNAM